MRAMNRLNARSRFSVVTLTSLLAVAAITAYFSSSVAVADPPPGAPVLTSFAVEDLGSYSWRLSGSVSSSEGYGGMTVYFGGSVVDDQVDPDSNGSFSKTITCEPQVGDWATAKATDRWGMDSNTAHDDFF